MPRRTPGPRRLTAGRCSSGTRDRVRARRTRWQSRRGAGAEQMAVVVSSADMHARYGSADHQLLDLLGALEDVVDLGVTVPALDRELADVAVAAEDLDGALGGPHRDPACLELG